MWSVFRGFLVLVVVPCAARAAVRFVSAGFLYPARRSAALQLFMRVDNSDLEPRYVSLRPHCCLLDAGDDCELIQYNKKGHCRFVYALDTARRRRSLRVDFDTRLSSRRGRRASAALVAGRAARRCGSLDEDPFAGCAPLDCEQRYNGERAFFNESRRVCERSPVCLPRRAAPPDAACDPTVNRCRRYRDRLSFADIAAIALRPAAGSVRRPPAPRGLARRPVALMLGQLAPGDSEDYTEAGLSVLYYVLAVCSFLIVFLCVLNCIIWLCGRTRECGRRRREEVKRGLLRDVMMTEPAYDLLGGARGGGARGAGCGARGGRGARAECAHTSFIAKGGDWQVHSDSSDEMP